MKIWMAEARSRLCDGVVFVPGAPGRGVGEEGFTGKTMVELAYDGTNRYFRCPHCSAKNIAIERTSQNGSSKIEVVRAYMDEA